MKSSQLFSGNNRWRHYASASVMSMGLLCFALAPVNAAAVEHEVTHHEKESSAQEGHEHEVGTHYHEASDIIGYDVRDENGKSLGSVHDLMVNSADEQVPFVVVSFNDILGYGGDLFALPWSGLQHNHEEGTCSLSVRRESDVPSNEDQDWIGLDADKEKENSDVSEFGLTPYWVKQDEAKEADPTKSSGLVSANHLIGSEVMDKSGESLGTVSDIIVHSEDGTIACAIVSFGGVVGIGDTIKPVPVALIQPRKASGQAEGQESESERFVIDTDKEALLKAPAYDPEKTLQAMNDEWIATVHGHYGVEVREKKPFNWERFQSSRSDSEGIGAHSIAVRDRE